MAQSRRSSKKKPTKKQKKELEEEEESSWDLFESFSDGSISSRTLRAVWGIALLALGVFFALAGIDWGGQIGTFLYGLLNSGFGVGYILIPLALFMASGMFFRSTEHEQVGPLRIISVILFVVASLGLINIVAAGKAGLLGSAISNPLIQLVDVPATVVFLLAFLIGSLMLAFDTHPMDIYHMATSWRQKDDEEDGEELLSEEDVEEDPEPIVNIPEDDEPEEYDEEEPEEAEEEPEPRHAVAASDEEDEGIATTSFDSEIIYNPPPLSLLAKNKGRPEVGDVKANTNIIKRTLQNFGIQVEMDEVSIGPSVTRYAMKPAEGVRLSKIVALQSNLELALAASPVRIEAPIPGKSLVGIEVPNTSRTTLGMSPILSDKSFANSEKPLYIGLGRDITGSPIYADLTRAPHLLIAGATGSGKSSTINDLIVSLLYRCGPQDLRFIMVDPKRVELTLYNSIPHLLTPVITDAKKAILALRWLAKEMDRRYDVLETERVRDISSYHENVLHPAQERGVDEGEKMPEAMPYIVVIIDELADIMQAYPRELEAGIVRLAQMSRAVGIHLVVSTQRPSVKVITGLIKANIPARIALQVASQIDSRTILDMGGAEKLLGAGDMLYLSGEMSKPQRIQAPYISESEVKKIVKYLADEYEGMLPSEIEFSDGNAGGGGSFPASLDEMDSDEEDDLYPDAKRAVLEAGRASTSYLQRKLRVGYARAARLMDILEERGVIGPADGAKPREILMQNGNDADGDMDDDEQDEQENDRM